MSNEECSVSMLVADFLHYVLFVQTIIVSYLYKHQVLYVNKHIIYQLKIHTMADSHRGNMAWIYITDLTSL